MLTNFSKSLLVILLAGTLHACGSDSNDNVNSSSTPSKDDPVQSDNNKPKDNSPIDEVKLSATDIKLQKIILDNNFTGNPMTGRDIPKITDTKAQVGKLLFYSKTLSGSKDVACATCHHPNLGGGDGLALAIGVHASEPNLLGVNRTFDLSKNPEGMTEVPRNAPTTFNLKGWDSVFFHDGRIESLGKTKGKNGNDFKGLRTPEADKTLATSSFAHEQARWPVTAHAEMRGDEFKELTNQQMRNYLAERLLGNDDKDTASESVKQARKTFWREAFQRAFELDKPEHADSYINEKNIALLIGEYENSQAFVDNAWQQYVSGDTNALTAQQKEGALLFFTPVSEGGANCASCHSGDFFSDEQFHNLAMPQIGVGKGDGEKAGIEGLEDFGRFKVTKNDADKYKFRTPSLLNVTETAPYSHAGAYKDLKAVIKHHLNPKAAIASYDSAQLTQASVPNVEKMQTVTASAVEYFEKNKATDMPDFSKVSLTDSQLDSIVSYMSALTDACTQDNDCMKPWTLDGVDDETREVAELLKAKF